MVDEKGNRLSMKLWEKREFLLSKYVRESVSFMCFRNGNVKHIFRIDILCLSVI